MTARNVASVILAAGFSTRMGRSKPLLPVSEDETFLERILRLHRRAGLHTYTVLGSDHEQIRRELGLQEDVSLLNPRPEDGPLSSIWLALRAIRDKPYSALLIHPVDHPLVDFETLSTLKRAHLEFYDKILIPRLQGRKGHPVLFPSTLFSALLAAPLHVGARAVVREHASEIRFVDVEDPAILQNVDTPSLYRRWVGLDLD